MDYENYLRQGLHLQGIPLREEDLPYIGSILSTINQAEAALEAFPYLNQETPVTIFDKELLFDDGPSFPNR